MNKTKYLLIFISPMVFIAGCIEGQTAINLNKNGSGKATFEGLLDYAAYSKTINSLPSQSEGFFLIQINQMMSDSNFQAWKDVDWKLLKNGKCYFKGTAYFDDINQTDFYIGSIKSNLKISLADSDKPTLELKYAPGGRAQQPALLQAANVHLIITLPGKIEKTENFELLDSQTAMLTIRGYKLSTTGGKLVFASDGRDLFDYRREVQKAQKESEKIIQTIENRLKEISIEQTPEKLLSETFNFKMRQGLTAESQKKFNEALTIYNSIINDPNADERFRAAANYQTGVCLLRTGEREKAETQFEYVINTFPLQRSAALKSVQMLRDMRFAETGIKEQEQKEAPFVVNAFPAFYSQDVDPNLTRIVLVFDQPMKKTDWFYSSFKTMSLPESNGLPYFDPCGVEWTLPVKLTPGKIYAIAVNVESHISNLKSQISNLKSQISNVPAGFAGVSGQRCEKFVLLFATLSKDGQPTDIDDEMIEECEKINYP